MPIVLPRWTICVLITGAAVLAAEVEPKKADAKVATLEDFYGDTGKRFQAALSFYNREPISSTISPNLSG